MPASFIPISAAEARTLGKAAREALPDQLRQQYSAALVRNILHSALWREANTILIYRAIGAEAVLDGLTDSSAAGRDDYIVHTEYRSSRNIRCGAGKTLCYPYCLPGKDHQMLALKPRNPAAWQENRYHIQEPDPDRSYIIDPRDIDLVICPCTAFDTAGHRVGMGGGYYDRFLPLCSHAVITAAAFSAQKVPPIAPEPWDIPMAHIFTE